MQHSSIGFYNRGSRCLLRGTAWVFFNKADYSWSQIVKSVYPYDIHLNYYLEMQEICAFLLNKIKEQSSGPDRGRSAY
jgi:hypothetical protein